MKTKFLHVNPILPSADVERDIKWYDEKLGFRCTYNSGVYEDSKPLNYAVLSRQDIFIHMQFQYPEDLAKMRGFQIRIQVENITPIFEEFKAKGVVKELRMNTPWGTSEFGFYDLNKNGIFFYEDI